VYQLAIGAGEGRARRDGSLRTPASWRVMVLSSGEVSIADKIAEGGKRAKAGQEIRILDLSANVGAGFGVFDSAGGFSDAAKFADAITKSSSEYCGTAGPEFVRRLIARGTEKITADIAKRIEAFVSLTAATEGHIQ